MFDQIAFQDKLAARMLALPSFCKLFACDARAKAGLSARGRERTRESARVELTAAGYSDIAAWHVVNDAQDMARLLYVEASNAD